MTTAKQKSIRSRTRDFKGRFKKKRYATPSEAREIFDRMYERAERQREAFLRTPEGEKARQEFNRRQLERFRAEKKNPRKRKARARKNPVRREFIIEAVQPRPLGFWYWTSEREAVADKARGVSGWSRRRQLAFPYGSEKRAYEVAKTLRTGKLPQYVKALRVVPA